MENDELSRIIGVGMGGEVKLPMGYRFLPSDFQLINCYLIPKVLRHVLPADVIPPIDVFHTNPWDLPGDYREKRYFFCKRGRKANKYKLLTGSGYWKAIGKQQVIWDTSGKKAIGLKRKLTFFHQTQNSATAIHDRWMMWEYRLATSINSKNKKNAIEEVGDWMVCAIICEKKNPINNNNNGATRIQLRRNTIEFESVGDGDVIDHCDHLPVTKTQPCHKRYRHNNNNNNNKNKNNFNVATLKNYGIRLSPQESSTSSSSSTITLATHEEEATN